MFISSAGSRSRLLTAIIEVLTLNFRREINEKQWGVLSGKEGTGMCGPDRVPCRPLRSTSVSFFI